MQPVEASAVVPLSLEETWAGCIVSRTTPTNSAFSASRSVSSLSLAETGCVSPAGGSSQDRGRARSRC